MDFNDCSNNVFIQSKMYLKTFLGSLFPVAWPAHLLQSSFLRCCVTLLSYTVVFQPAAAQTLIFGLSLKFLMDQFWHFHLPLVPLLLLSHCNHLKVQRDVASSVCQLMDPHLLIRIPNRTQQSAVCGCWMDLDTDNLLLKWVIRVVCPSVWTLQLIGLSDASKRNLIYISDLFVFFD